MTFMSGGTVLAGMVSTAHQLSKSAPETSSAPWWQSAALVAVAASVCLGFLSAFVTSRENRKQRAATMRTELHDRYGTALSLALAWIEVPFRIARRTSDDPATISTLAERVHDLQEQIDHNCRWLAFESPLVGDAYQALVAATKIQVGPHIKSAWRNAPAAAPADQILDGNPFPVQVEDECAAFLAASRAHLDEVTFVPNWPWQRHKPLNASSSTKDTR
jgi:hypothetical protein